MALPILEPRAQGGRLRLSRPIREPEAWMAWCDEAARLGLHVGDRSELDALLVGAQIPLRPLDLDSIIVERTRLARLRRPAYRVEGLTIIADPLGLVDNLSRACDELRWHWRDAHSRAIVDDVDRQIAEGRSRPQAARTWSRSARTLRRRRADTAARRTPPKPTRGSVER